jgi:hypothetical protein
MNTEENKQLKEMEKIWERVKTITWKQLTPNLDNYKPSWDFKTNFQYVFRGGCCHHLSFYEEIEHDQSLFLVYGEFWDEIDEDDNRDTYVEFGNRKYPTGVNNFQKWFYTFEEAVKFLADLNITLDLKKVYRP